MIERWKFTEPTLPSSSQPFSYNQIIHRLIHVYLGMTVPLLPKLKSLPTSFPKEGAVRIELEEGIPMFGASSTVQNRIEELEKQQDASLSIEEEQELDCYEEIETT